jgi:DNA-binding IclR family transcriptional regulator
LEVLEYFDRDRPEATVSDISRALNYPQSSSSVLLRCMRQLGYLYFNRKTRTYRPTARVALLGAWIDDGGFCGGRVLTLASHVAKQVGETVLLSGIGVDFASHNLHVVPGAKATAVDVRVGRTEPLLSSAQGELLLASYGERQIRLALHRMNAEESAPERRVKIADKVQELQEMRRRGWTIRANSADARHGHVAVLMPRRKGGDRLVLSVVADKNAILAQGKDYLQTILAERDRIFAARQM